MRYLLVMLFTCYFAGTASAASMVDLKDRCGVVQLDGYLRKDGDSFVLKLYEKSRSEIVFKLDKSFDTLAGLFLNEPITLKGELKSPVVKYRGVVFMAGLAEKDPRDVFKRDDIQLRIPDPLSPKRDFGIKFIEEKKCER